MSPLAIGEEQLAEFCRKQHIRRLSLFGSTFAGTARPDSDIDLLVEFEPGREPGLLGLAAMEAELSALLGGRRSTFARRRISAGTSATGSCGQPRCFMRDEDRVSLINRIEAVNHDLVVVVVP